MCPNCEALLRDSSYPHATLRWRMDEFDPTATEALGAKIYEECTICGERWFEERTQHRKSRSNFGAP